MGTAKARLEFPLKGTRALIFYHLLNNDSNAIELEEKLGINESAVRRHLDTLTADGFATYYIDSSQVGRPKKMYRVSPAGRELLPKKTSVLLSMLTKRISEVYGKQALSSLMGLVTDDFAGYLRHRGKPIATGDKDRSLREMVRLFNDLGFMASLSKKEGEYLITYRNCVFHDAMAALDGHICEMHKKVLLRSLGNCKIESEKSIFKGDNNCLQRIQFGGRTQ